jgi:hypothetical protein
MPCACGLNNNNNNNRPIINMIKTRQVMLARQQQIQKMKLLRLQKIKQQMLLRARK